MKHTSNDNAFIRSSRSSSIIHHRARVYVNAPPLVDPIDICSIDRTMFIDIDLNDEKVGTSRLATSIPSLSLQPHLLVFELSSQNDYRWNRTRYVHNNIDPVRLVFVARLEYAHDYLYLCCQISCCYSNSVLTTISESLLYELTLLSYSFLHSSVPLNVQLIYWRDHTRIEPLFILHHVFDLFIQCRRVIIRRWWTASVIHRGSSRCSSSERRDRSVEVW